MSAEVPRRNPRRSGFAETELERRGTGFDTAAPVTGAVVAGDAVAVGFGDGTVRFFRPGLAPVATQAHDGVVLCLAADGDYVLTGGDDGRFLQISPSGDVEEIANFGSRWVDCVAAGHGLRACSSGRTVQVWSRARRTATVLEHPSTAGGLAFDGKSKRLAVAHYGGATVWTHGAEHWEASMLTWHGSHGAVTFSPDGEYLVTAMQENALHCWRLLDKCSLELPGYPAKIKSFAWVGSVPHLATSGADEAICWPFDSKNGPLARAPLCVAHGGKQIATYVQALPGEQAVLAGFQDGAVLLAELDESKGAVVLKGSSGAAITAIAVSACRSHLLIGDEKGNVLWTPIQAEDPNARPV